MSNRLVEFVLGSPDPNAPACFIEQTEDQAEINERMKANMRASGAWHDCELDHLNIKAPVGSGGRLTQHPSAAVRPRET